MSVIIPIFHVLLPSNPICYCVQFSTFIEYLQDSVYEKAKRMNSSLDNVAKELMSQDEIAVMDGGKCIMQLRGVRPFFSNKFDITKHKQYRLLSDFDDKNALDIEKYVKNLCKARVRDNDTVDEVEDAGVIEA